MVSDELSGSATSQRKTESTFTSLDQKQTLPLLQEGMLEMIRSLSIHRKVHLETQGCGQHHPKSFEDLAIEFNVRKLQQ